MHRVSSPLAVVLVLAAALAGYLLGSGSPVRAELTPGYEYKVFTILEFEIQGEKIPGDEWIRTSHLDLPHKKFGDALVKDRAIMTKVLNAMAADGWEPVMIYVNAVVARRPAPK